MRNIWYTNFKFFVKFNSGQFRFCGTLLSIFKVVYNKNQLFDKSRNVYQITANLFHYFLPVVLYVSSSLIFPSSS